VNENSSTEYQLKSIVERILTGVKTRLKQSLLLNGSPASFLFIELKMDSITRGA
jgi:hypothetical protein